MPRLILKQPSPRFHAANIIYENSFYFQINPTIEREAKRRYKVNLVWHFVVLSWFIVFLYSFMWFYLELCDFIWFYMVKCGFIWSNEVLSNYFVVLYGSNVQQYMVFIRFSALRDPIMFYGSLWFFLVLYGQCDV